MLNARIIKRPDTAAIMKQINFGTSKGLSDTAKEGQKAVQTAARLRFNVRGPWLEERNKYGIRYKRATRDKLTAIIHTDAGWLKKQKIGGRITANMKGRVFPYEYAGKRYIAIPTRELRPKGSKKIIWPRNLWPDRLKGRFVIDSGGTKMLMSRFGPGKKGVAAMYILVPDADIKPVDVWEKPIRAVIALRLKKNIQDGIKFAFATAR